MSPTSSPRPGWDAPSSGPDRRWIADNDPEPTGVLGEQLLRLVLTDASSGHDDRGFDTALGRVDHGPRGTAVQARGLHDNPLTAVNQFLVPGPQIHHQVPVGLAQPDH